MGGDEQAERCGHLGVPMRDFIQKRINYVFTLLLISGFGIQAATLTRYPPPTCDEAFYGRSASLYVQSFLSQDAWSPSEALFFMPHGRLYWALLWGALTLFGQSLYAARLVSLLGWVTLVVATYLVGKKSVGEQVALWSAGLTGMAWLSLFTGHLARPDVLAAASGMVVIWLLFRTLDRPSKWLLYVLGFMIVAQLDLHMNMAHFFIPVVTAAAYWLVQGKRFFFLLWLSGGIITGAVFIMLGHVADMQTIGLMMNDPIAFLDLYLGTDHIGSNNVIGVIQESVISYSKFWSLYYGSTPPTIAIPQGFLFLYGILSAYMTGNKKTRLLLWVTVISNMTFAILHRSYFSYSYAVLWLPYYILLSVTAIRRTRIPVRWSLLNRHGAQIVLASWMCFYSAGDVYLLRNNSAQMYKNDVELLLQDIRPDSRVLTSSYWWYGMYSKTVFLDEHIVAPVGSNVWWQGVPDMDRNGAAALLPYSHEDSPDAWDNMTASDGVALRLSEVLRPDYLIIDQVLGCSDAPDGMSESLVNYASQACVREKTIRTQLHGWQSVYSCRKEGIK